MTLLCSVPWLIPSSWLKADATQQCNHLGTAEQSQQALKFASMGDGGVELDCKSASIKSISDSIQSSNACSLSSCSISLFSRLRSIALWSAARSCRQLSVAHNCRAALDSSVKNEWRRESDETDVPLLLEGEDVAGEVDVVTGGEERNESNQKASNRLNQTWRGDLATAQPGPHQRTGVQSRKPKQESTTIVHAHYRRRGAEIRASCCRTPISAIPIRRPSLMDLAVYTRYFRCKTANRQCEIDEYLRRNLNRPGIRKLVLFKESDAQPLPEASMDLEVVEKNTRITNSDWLRWVQRKDSGVSLLLNADIYLDVNLEHLAATFDSPESFLALSRHNPGHTGFHLNDYPHWAQDVRGRGVETELPASLHYASGFPLGFPGCDNRGAYGSNSVHLQPSTARVRQNQRPALSRSELRESEPRAG